MKIIESVLLRLFMSASEKCIIIIIIIIIIISRPLKTICCISFGWPLFTSLTYQFAQWSRWNHKCYIFQFHFITTDTCLLPIKIAKFVDESKHKYEEGDTISNFFCDSDYKLSSHDSMTCQHGGKWSTVVECIKGNISIKTISNCCFRLASRDRSIDCKVWCI